ncbi:hypothetical protein Patl1_35349 [Pistacia atlantica]|nr:hypothetical protein Patl1_35349 [Pistacia atlantica]
MMSYLEEWTLLDKDHFSSLLGATEALKASTLRLPIVGKAIADIQKLKDAISSSVDAMQAMASSIYLLSSKERIFLEQCKDFSSTLAAMQVKNCSLRTHIIQLNHVRTTRSLTTRV